MHDVKKITFESLRKLSIILGTEVTEERVQIYCEMIAPFAQNMPSEAFLYRMNSVARVFIKFPSYAEFETFVKNGIDSKDEAQIMSGEIIDAISRFGRYQNQEAKKYLGSVAWFVVKKFGGWELLCKMNESEMNTARAQLRELSKSSIKLDALPNMIDKPLLNNAKSELKALSFDIPQLETK